MLFVLLGGCDALGLPADESVEGGDNSADEEARLERERTARFREFQESAEPGTCNGWKVSYCAAVEKCSAFSSHEQCELDVGYVRCAEAAPFGWCEAEINAAIEDDDCEALPKDCNPSDLADRRIPTQECRAIYEAICEFQFFCGNELSQDTCLAALELKAPCSEYTAVLPQSTECIDAYSLLACGESTPAVCAGVLRY